MLGRSPLLPLSKAARALYPQLWYVGEVAFAKLLFVDVVVDVDGLFPGIAPQLLDEFAGHPRPSEVGSEPVAATVRRKMVFHLIRV